MKVKNVSERFDSRNLMQHYTKHVREDGKRLLDRPAPYTTKKGNRSITHPNELQNSLKLQRSMIKELMI